MTLTTLKKQDFYAARHFITLSKLIGRYITIILIGLIFLLTTSTLSHATVYYVSSTGNDANPGTNPEEPWKTLNKVNNVFFSPGDQVLFKRGDSWIGTLQVNTSGAAGNYIVYGAYGEGPRPKIYGSLPVENWSRYSGNIYYAPFNSNIRQLFADTSKMQAARYPNEGYILVNSVQNSKQFTSNSLDPTINYSGAKWFGRTRQWTADIRDVTYSVGRSLMLNYAPQFGLHPQEGFFLMNKLEFLDQPGEWYYNSFTNTVYLWLPDHASPEEKAIRATTTDYGIHLYKKSYISIQDLEFLHHGEAGIYLDECSHITISGNTITYPDGYGILDATESSHFQIINNTVTGANHYGMYLRISHSEISENIISKIALFDNIGLTGTGRPDYGGGIYLAGEEGNNQIRYNRITETGYHGICFSKPKNLIEYNFIQHACLVKDDGGGIYGSWSNRSLPGTQGTIIRHNIILNVPGNMDGYTANRAFGEGIYVDESAEDVEVSNNTVAYVSDGGIYLHNNAGTKVSNNLIMDARYGVMVNKDHGLNYVQENIFYAMDHDEYEPNQLLALRNSSRAVFNSNRYVNHYNSAKIFKNGSTHYDFPGWQSVTGRDENSTVDLSPLGKGEKEQLIYNDTRKNITFHLGNGLFKDVYNNRITGPITLEPFTSAIVIGANFRSINRNPIIQEHAFRLDAPVDLNVLIGQVSAFDPDTGQVLSYHIAEGNASGLFSINSATGEILTAKEINTAELKSFIIKVQAVDNVYNSLSDTAEITITIKPSIDMVPPKITAFSLPISSHLLTVPVSAFAATDNIGVTGFMFTQSGNAPSPDDENWLNEMPVNITFQSQGEKTIYLWVKDESGNVSNPAMGIVNIRIPAIETNEYVSICEGEQYMGWDTTGVYTRTLKATSGTDSIVTTELVITPVYNVSEEIIISADSSYNGWNEPGVYDRILSSVHGCDSIVTTTLKVMKHSTENIQICSGEIYNGWDTSGVYQREFVTADGSDSIVTTNLEVLPVYHAEEYIEINQGEDYYGFNRTGEYVREFSSVNGCDSIIVTRLKVIPLPVDVITYEAWSASEKQQRQGLDTLRNRTELLPVRHESGQSNYPQQDNRNDATPPRKVTEVNALAAYNMFDGNNLSVSKNDFILYPNPAQTGVNVQLNLPDEKKAQLEIISFGGKRMMQDVITSNPHLINIHAFPSGIYYVRITHSNGSRTKKLIVGK